MTKILIINGPNLNFLGIREPEIYGKQTYNDLVHSIEAYATELECKIDFFQSNHEGGIIDRLQDAYYDGTQGIVINPGAYTHYSYAIHDALAALTNIPKIEVHISDINAREDFRKISVTRAACNDQISGQGFRGYMVAIDKILEEIAQKDGTK